MTSGAGFGLLFGQAKGAAGVIHGVVGELALPGVVPGRPTEAALFELLAGLVVGLFVKEDLEPVRSQVADDLAAGELCVGGGLLGGLGGQAGEAVEGFVLAVVGVQRLLSSSLFWSFWSWSASISRA